MSPAIKVFLLDDHEIVRRGLRELLESEDDITIVGEASTEDEAVRRVPALDPDVAVLDVRLAEGNGVEACREIRSRHPRTQCLILTSFSDDEALFEAIMAARPDTSSSRFARAISSPPSGGLPPVRTCSIRP